MLVSRHLGWDDCDCRFYILSCVCWICVLFLGFCCPLWLLGKQAGLGLPGRKCFWDSARCCHWSSWLESFSWYWELTLRNGNKLKGVRWKDPQEQKSWVCPHNLHRPLKMDSERRAIVDSLLRSWQCHQEIEIGGEEGEWRSPTWFPIKHSRWVVPRDCLPLLVPETKSQNCLHHKEIHGSSMPWFPK